MNVCFLATLYVMSVKVTYDLCNNPFLFFLNKFTSKIKKNVLICIRNQENQIVKFMYV